MAKNSVKTWFLFAMGSSRPTGRFSFRRDGVITPCRSFPLTLGPVFKEGVRL
jgi:hypothetical protein